MHFATRVRTAYEHIRHLWRRAAFFTTLLQCHYQQSQRPTDASHRFTCVRDGQHWTPNPNYCIVKWLYLWNRSEQNTCTYTLFCLEWPILWSPRIFYLPSLDTLYIAIAFTQTNHLFHENVLSIRKLNPVCRRKHNWHHWSVGCSLTG
jgi:hypothetical protein